MAKVLLFTAGKHSGETEVKSVIAFGAGVEVGAGVVADIVVVPVELQMLELAALAL